MIVEVSQYKGDWGAQIAATQLDEPYTATQARRILDEWVEFLSAGPTPIHRLRFLSRTPKRLFAALAGQTQLEELHVKWGDYDDLTAIAGLSELRTLTLGGASAVQSIQRLAALHKLSTLDLELRHVHDLTALASLPALTSLTVGGGMWQSLHLDSLGFLRSMPQLQQLTLGAIVDDRDFTPLLNLPALTEVWVAKNRGMTPTIAELQVALPWNDD